MINIEFNTKHWDKEFGILDQGAFFTVLAEVEHPLYIKTEIFKLTPTMAINAIELNTGKGYYIKNDIIVVDYNADVLASEVTE